MHSGTSPATTSPLLTEVLERKRLLYKSESKWKWALLNLVGAVALTIEANGYSSLQPFVDSRSPWRTLISRVEMFCVVVLMTNAILDTLNYFFPFFKFPSLKNSGDAGLNVVGKDLVLTPKQMSLFKINKGDLGFKESTPNKPKVGDKEKHPFGFPPPLEGSFIASSPNSTRGSLYNRSGYLSGDSTGGFGGNFSTVDSSSWYYHPNSPGYQAPTTSPTNTSRILPKFNPTTTENGAISDQADLKVFLKEYNEWEKSFNQTGASDPNLSGEQNASANLSNTSFWKPAYSNTNLAVGSQVSNATPTFQDFSPILKKMSYQLSTAIPETSSLLKTSVNEPMDHSPVAPSISISGVNGFTSIISTPSSPLANAGIDASNYHRSAELAQSTIASPTSAQSGRSTDLICRRLGIDSIQLVTWMENLRMWISQTILARIVKEIKQTNELLVKYGMAEEQIGKIGLDKLRKVSTLPHILERIPSLDALMPFLEISNQQDYLVNRLSELSTGGAMSSYKWNSGGRYKGSEWSDKLPTDAEIVMNSVAAYLDVRMPKHYHYSGNIDGKPFTGTYYLKKLNSESQKSGSSGKSENSADPKAEKLSFFAKLLASTKSPNLPTPKEPEVNPVTTETAQQHKNFVIVQTAQKPPHFIIQLNSKEPRSSSSTSNSQSGNSSSNNAESLEVGAGRNNLFHALLLFLHLIKTEEHGMLGRINFGSSGINVLWVLENH